MGSQPNFVNLVNLVNPQVPLDVGTNKRLLDPSTKMVAEALAFKEEQDELLKAMSAIVTEKQGPPGSAEARTGVGGGGSVASRFPDVSQPGGGSGGSGGGFAGGFSAAMAAAPHGHGSSERDPPRGLLATAAEKAAGAAAKPTKKSLFAKINALTVQRTAAEKAEAVVRAKEASRRAAIALAKAEAEVCWLVHFAANSQSSRSSPMGHSFVS